MSILDYRRGCSISSLLIPECRFHIRFKSVLSAAQLTMARREGNKTFFSRNRELFTVIVKLFLCILGENLRIPERWLTPQNSVQLIKQMCNQNQLFLCVIERFILKGAICSRSISRCLIRKSCLSI